MSHLGAIDLPTLRIERERLVQEAERLVWLRRLVMARRDLEVARLMGAGAGLWGTDAVDPVVLDSLGGGACPELLRHLSHSLKVLTIAADGAQCDLGAATAELMRRYHKTPGLCLRRNGAAVLVDALG